MKTVAYFFILQLILMIPCSLKAQKTIKIDNPKLTVFLPEKPTGRAVLILPGGGYEHLAVENEGMAWSSFFLEKGIAMAVLEYTMPSGNPAKPFGDVEESMRILHENSESWGIDKKSVGIMGFSAGGHLASTFATHCHSELAPAFQILFYPVITMDERFTHQGSRDNLLGKTPSAEIVDKYSNEKQVTESTPRAIILLSDGDNIVPAENSTAYYLALTKHKVPASLHIYPSGWHGFGFNSDFKYHNDMIGDLSSWLESF